MYCSGHNNLPPLRLPREGKLIIPETFKLFPDISYLRTVKVRSSSGSINEYVRVVEAYRDNGKVKQRTLADLGRKDLLVEILPK